MSGGFAVTTPPPASPTGSMEINVADPNGTAHARITTSSSIPSLQFGTGDFTIEFWMRPTAFIHAEDYLDRVVCVIGNYGDGSGTSPYVLFGFRRPQDGIYGTPFIKFDNYTPTEVGSPLNLNTWYHIAITRSSNVLRIYINGTQIYTDSNSIDLTQSNPWIGSGGVYIAMLDAYSGYLTNFRAVKGVAVYTSNFTPPTSPLAATQSANTNGNPSAAITGGQTGLLLNSVSSGTLLTDSSSYALGLENNGIIWNSISPFA
jgi:hypothetical protein